MDFWEVFIGILLAFCIGILLLFLKYAIFRREFGKKFPMRKLRFFDILGTFNDLPSVYRKYNGYPFNVLILQYGEGLNQIFKESQLFLAWGSFHPAILLKKADAVEAYMSGNQNLEKNWTYRMLHPWLGTGLLTSHGSKWKSRRKLLTPAFHFDILKDFLPVINEQSNILVKHLQKEITEDFTNIVEPITLCSLDIICETILGVKISAQENADLPYVKAVKRGTEILTKRPFNIFHWSDFIFSLTKNGREFYRHLSKLHDFTRSVIQERKKNLLDSNSRPDDGKHKRKALLDLLLEHHIEINDITEEDIREEVDTFVFEGHDTTAFGITWTLYLIGLHKDVQDKIQQELDLIFGDDVERPVETRDLTDMKYLECVIKESLRLYPPVPMVARTTSEDLNICGYPLPKGCSVGIAIYLLHKDESVFPNPEKFDPDRFLPENCINRHPFAFIPFSAGPRNCIGQRFALMEVKVVLSCILRHYTLESLDHRDKIPKGADIILKPAVPVRMRIRPRK